MSENQTSGTSNGDSNKRPHSPNLRPFKPGQSGNPSGRSKRYAERYTALKAELEATGVLLSVDEGVTLELAVRLSLRRPKDDMAASHAASTYQRLLKPLRARRAKAAQDDDSDTLAVLEALERQ